MDGRQGQEPWKFAWVELERVRAFESESVKAELALAEQLRPYWHQHRLPVCCGRCGRRITTIHRDCGHVLGEPRHYRTRWTISSLGDQCAAVAAGGGRRITFICRCGARATRRMDRLIRDFINARDAGRPKLIVGQGEHEVG